MALWKVGQKEVKVPLIQGGMGIGISLGGLAGAVAKEGGVGIISTAQIGFKEENFDQNPPAANKCAIEKEMKKARRISPEGIIGFNIMVALREYEQHVRAAVEAGADIIISGAGLPVDLPVIVAGSSVAIAPIVSTEKSARVILKYWDKKYRRTADLIVIEGPKAGGHLGFSRQELDIYSDEVYDGEIKRIISVVRDYSEKYNIDIPVIVAGGIYDNAGVKHALSLGANGVQVASRFVTTEECDAEIRYKNAYINASKEDIIIVKSPVGMPGRAILNPFMKCVMLNEKIPHTPCHGCLAKCSPSDIPYCITDGLIAAAEGRIDEALLFCGANAYRAERIETVAEVIASLFGVC